MTKVKIPREVAEAIEKAKYSFNLGAFVDFSNGSLEARSNYSKILRREFDKEALLQAVFYGYEVEEMPEERMLAEFKAVNGACTSRTEFGRAAIERRKGILVTMETLGIKITGVNA